MKKKSINLFILLIIFMSLVACSDTPTYTNECAGGMHDLIKYESKEPSCIEIGYDAYEKCTRCDYTTYVEVPALGHSYEKFVTEPTTETQGYTTYTCHCGDSYVSDYVDVIKHIFTDWYIVNNPTCIDEGLEQRDCTTCDYCETNVLNALGHDIVEHEAVDATCISIGWNKYDTCRRCDYTTYVELPALGHSYNEWSSNNDGTHTHVCQNNNEHTEVENCSFGNWITVTEAGPFTEGLEKRICTECNYEETRIVASTHEHIYSDEYTIDLEPTCTTEGSKSKHCTKDNCSSVIDETSIPVLGHTYGEVEYSWNETYTQVVAKRVCQNDESHIETETVVATYKVINEATCEEEGLGRYTSNSFNNEAFSVQTYEVVIEALGHDIVEHEAVDATCTSIGWNKYDTCKRCDYTTYVELPALGHEYESVITKPTCTEQGYTTYTCHCGDTYKDEYVNALGHTYGEVEYNWNETYTQVVAKRVCQNDESHIETETVVATYKVINEATCEEEGLGRYTSNSFNNEAFSVQTYEVVIEALGHDIVEYECTKCDYSQEFSIEYVLNEGTNNINNPALYSYSNGASLYEATKRGYSFCGWFKDSGYQEEIVLIEPFTVGDLTIYAKWEKVYVFNENTNELVFGSYPQSEVTDETTISTLSSMIGTLPTSSNNYNWISYGYYTNSSNATNYMWYQDIELTDNKYRAVYFTNYRSATIDDSSSADTSYQDDNGYYTSTVYYFRFDPIIWKVLTIDENNNKALLFANIVLDSHAYNLTKGSQEIDGKTIYANNYEYSFIRSWLNDCFYNIAFTKEEQDIILNTIVDNSAKSTGITSNQYACNNTNDKVFLLSYEEVTNGNYGFTTSENSGDVMRQIKTTAYSRVQGAVSTTDTNYLTNNNWWLRSSHTYRNDTARYIAYDGGAQYCSGILCTFAGVVPALWIELV